MKKEAIRSRPGMTLVEMLVVLAIILILAGFGVVGFLRVMRTQAKKEARIQIDLISSSLDAYSSANGGYPQGEGSNLLYRVLYLDPADGGGTVHLAGFGSGDWISGEGESATVIDPWGNEYGYRCLGDQNPDFDLWSAGPDGEADRSNRNAPENRDNIEN